jgi:tetratricopeptide (TPR) repeat protein
MRIRVQSIAVLLIMVTVLTVPAQTRSNPGASGNARLQPLPEILEAAASDPDPRLLLEMALRFSTSAADRAAAARLAIDQAMHEATGLIHTIPDAGQRAEAILDLIHQRFLRRYIEAETTLDAAVLDGRYNCVSSAVLYLILARSAGLTVEAAVTKDHSFCVVRLEDRDVDVETTNPAGYDPGTRKDFHDSFGRVTGYSYVPPSDKRNRQAVDARHLTALILWNRATILERQGRWAEAVALAVDAQAWAPSADASRQLIDRLYNNAGAMLNARRWDEALPFIEAALAAHGPAAQLEDLAGQARLAILADRLEVLPPADGIELVLAAWQDGLIAQNRRNELLAYGYGRLAEAARAAGGWYAAWQVLETGLALIPGYAQMTRMTETARQNWTYEVHNRFVTLYNARQYHEALRILEEALVILPGEQLFLADVNAARKAIATAP